MKKRKKALAMLLAAVAVTGCFTGCGKDTSSEGDTASKDIYVISREESSGTRGAFIELTGVEQKDSDGNKADKTVTTAEITQSTAVMITTVQGNDAAIGYISLGSLDEKKVKALKVDGAEATVENIKNGDYKLARPFNIAVKDNASDEAKDFISYILSTEGQAIVEDEGYIPVDNTKAYEKSNAKGKIVVGGSSSVGPVMEAIIAEYKKVNTDITVELNVSDSSTGMTGTIDGTLDIGMASRELKDSELEKGLVPTQIATDGIAVIVNKDNGVSEITTEQIMKIYTGEITNWGDIK